MVVWLAHEANASGANIAMMEYAVALRDVYDFHFILPHGGNMIAKLNDLGFPTTIIHQYGWAVASTEKTRRVSLRVKLRSIKAVVDTCLLIKKLDARLVFTNTQVAFTAAIAADKLNLPHVWWLHEFGEEDFGFAIGFGKREKAERLIRKSKLIICNSEAVKKKFVAQMPYINIERIYQPVSFQKEFVQTASVNILRYLMFGQLIPAKGHIEVMKALLEAKKVDPSKKFTLHIKGPSEDAIYLQDLQHFIVQNHLQQDVKIETGFFDKETVLPSYDVLIVASTAEAFGRVIMEAGKAGLKVIVKNAGGAPELMNDTNGVLYNNTKELTDILAGKITLPNGAIRFNYNEEEEIIRLKNYLAIL